MPKPLNVWKDGFLHDGTPLYGVCDKGLRGNQLDKQGVSDQGGVLHCSCQTGMSQNMQDQVVCNHRQAVLGFIKHNGRTAPKAKEEKKDVAAATPAAEGRAPAA